MSPDKNRIKSAIEQIAKRMGKQNLEVSFGEQFDSLDRLEFTELISKTIGLDTSQALISPSAWTTLDSMTNFIANLDIDTQ